MSGSRGFLLALLLATVACIVVVQISMDGWILRRSFHPTKFPEKTKSQREILEASTVSNITARPSRIVATSKATTRVKLKPPTKLNDSKQKLVTKASQQLQAKVSKRQPLSRIFSLSARGPNLPVLVDRQTKLQEILKHKVVRTRLRTSPLKAVKSLPIVKPENVTRVFLITYFRSGSSFVGELLQQSWKTFYQFEPLHYMTYDSRIPDNKTKEAFDLFASIYDCNFANLDKYFKWVRRSRNQFLFARSLFLWFYCRTEPKLCFFPEFVSAVCQRAPVRLIKVTRINMRQMKDFLHANANLSIKVIYLTRDPRGILSSRWSLDWCNGTDCSDPNFLCNEMAEDIAVYDELSKSDPSNFIQVRYEDIALNPMKEAARLFKFMKVPFPKSLEKFLRSHTTARKGDSMDPYSTRRNSSSVAFSWRQRFSFEQVNSVQASCSNVIQKLNYSMITSPSELDHPNITLRSNITAMSKVPEVNPNSLITGNAMRTRRLELHNQLPSNSSTSSKTLSADVHYEATHILKNHSLKLNSTDNLNGNTLRQ